MPRTDYIYRVVCLLTSILYLYLFGNLLVSPATFLADFGVGRGAAIELLARRVSSLMLAFGVLLLLQRNLPPSPARQALACAVGLNMSGFAISGAFGLTRHIVQSSVIVPTLIEIVVAFSWFSIAATDHRALAKHSPR